MAAAIERGDQEPTVLRIKLYPRQTQHGIQAGEQTEHWITATWPTHHPTPRRLSIVNLSHTVKISVPLPLPPGNPSMFTVALGMMRGTAEEAGIVRTVELTTQCTVPLLDRLIDR